jgi:thymidylate synthase (FAD)
MKVRLIAKSMGFQGTEYEGKTLDEIIVGIARVSSSRSVNELFDEPYKLIRHCISNGHWSVFTMVNLGFEITTSRAIGREYLRHSQSKMQEFSQRYSSDVELEPVELRKQSKNNRQSSTDTCDPFITYEMPDRNIEYLASDWVENHNDASLSLYRKLIEAKVSRETARFILPECTQTTIIMNATVREWITTLNQRLHKTAQKEARLIAEAIRDEFIEQLPLVSQALFNFDNAYNVHVLDRVVLEKYGVYSDKL